MTWQRLLSREDVDLPTICAVDTVFYYHFAKYGIKREILFTHIQNRKITHYINMNPEDIGLFVFKKQFSTPEKIEEYFQLGEKTKAETKEKTTKWKKKAEKNLAATFIQFRKDFQKLSYIFNISSWLAIEAWQNAFERTVKSLLTKNKLKEKEVEIMTALTKPWKDTALHHIQKELQKGTNPKKLAEKFQFLRSWVAVWYKPLSVEWVKGIGVTPKTLSTLSFEEAIKLLNPSGEEEKMVRLAPYIFFFKDYRDDVRRFFAYCWSFVFDLIAKQWVIPRDDIGYLTLDEIEEALTTKSVPHKKITQRKIRPYIVSMDLVQNKIKVYNTVLPLYSKILEAREQQEQSSSIKGIIAQKGLVRGKVVIIRSHHDLKKVQTGDILVANTTHPTYLPAMYKAAAFITNEGGVACHAAIVARELGKPCIIGTKVATKILKDGDLIEVDANKGVVRKL